MIVSNNEDENDNCPRLLFEEMRYIKPKFIVFRRETLRVEDKHKYQDLYKIKARDLANKSVNLSTNCRA